MDIRYWNIFCCLILSYIALNDAQYSNNNYRNIGSSRYGNGLASSSSSMYSLSKPGTQYGYNQQAYPSKSYSYTSPIKTGYNQPKNSYSSAYIPRVSYKPSTYSSSSLGYGSSSPKTTYRQTYPVKTYQTYDTSQVKTGYVSPIQSAQRAPYRSTAYGSAQPSYSSSSSTGNSYQNPYKTIQSHPVSSYSSYKVKDTPVYSSGLSRQPISGYGVGSSKYHFSSSPSKLRPVKYQSSVHGGESEYSTNEIDPCRDLYEGDYVLSGPFRLLYPRVDPQCYFIKCANKKSFVNACGVGTKNDEYGDGYCSTLDLKGHCGPTVHDSIYAEY